MLVCEHCMAYLMSMASDNKMMVSAAPVWEYDEDEEDNNYKCEWCGDSLEECGELYNLDF